MAGVNSIISGEIEKNGKVLIYDRQLFGNSDFDFSLSKNLDSTLLANRFFSWKLLLISCEHRVKSSVLLETKIELRMLDTFF